MAVGDFVYPKAQEHALKADFDLDSDTLRAYLIDAADYAAVNTHNTLSDVPGAARVAVKDLTGVTVTNGVVDANDFQFDNVTGDVSEALLFVIWKGSDAASFLLCYVESWQGLPQTPNGSNITVAIPPAGICSI